MKKALDGPGVQPWAEGPPAGALDDGLADGFVDADGFFEDGFFEDGFLAADEPDACHVPCTHCMPGAFGWLATHGPPGRGLGGTAWEGVVAATAMAAQVASVSAAASIRPGRMEQR